MGIQLGSTVVNNIFSTTRVETSISSFITSGSVVGLLSASYSNAATWSSTTGSGLDVINNPLVGQATNGRWQFNGSDEYINIPQSRLDGPFNTTSPNAYQRFTFLFYGTIGSLSTNRALYGPGGGGLSYSVGGDAILRTDTSPGSGKIHLDLRGPGPNFNRYTISGDSGSLLNLAISQNTAGTQSVYQDGVLVATSGALASGYSPFRSSNNTDGANLLYNLGTDASTYNGQLGGMFLYNTVLSGSQIPQSAEAFYSQSILVTSQVSPITSVFIGNEKVFPSAAPTASYLFDVYSGARFGYSLRKLSSTYTGSAVRVRRSNDNAEQDIGFVGEALDTASLSTFVGSNSAFVTKWYDQANNNRVAAQTTAANQPRIVNAGTIETENGKPAVNFGTNSNNWWLDLPSGALAASNLTSYFQVARVNTFASSNAAVFGPSTDNSKGIEVLQHDVISIPSYLRLNNTAKNTSANPLWTNNAQGMFTFITNASSTAAWNNASSVTLSSTSAMGTLNFTGVYAIGRYAGSSTNVMSGEWQELVVYQTDQTSNRTGIQSNINTYYAIY